MKFKLLSENLTQYYCEKIRIPEAATKLLIEIAQKINADEKLLEIYKDFYSKYIESGYWESVWEKLDIDLYVQEVFKEYASLFYLHAALEKLPFTEQRYSELGIEEDIFVETLRDIGVWVQNAYDLVGYYCIRNFSWIWRHLEAKMFRIGRLQFIAVPFTGDVKGLYNSEENTTLLLCNSGMELRSNGDMQGVCGKEKTEDGFVTEYHETEEFFIGNPVTPCGKGLKTQVKLEKHTWRKILDKGDYLFEIHIPKDGNFELEDIKQSYILAKAFFKKHFVEYEIRGMVCHTWLFTPQLQELLPQSSNIVKFQRQFYLYPTAGAVKYLWNFVFNELTEEKDAKPDTSLRRQVLNYLKEGKEIFDMRGVYLEVAGDIGDVTYTYTLNESLL